MDKDRSGILVVAAHAPFLTIRLSFLYLRMKRQANNARKRFYRELVNNGMPKEDAGSLADEYSSTVSLRNMMSLARESAPLGQRGR